MMSLQPLQLQFGGGAGHSQPSCVHLPSLPLYLSTTVSSSHHQCHRSSQTAGCRTPFTGLYLRRKSARIPLAGKEETQLRTSIDSGEDWAESEEASPEDLECVGQIKRVLELLKKNRDMLFSEVKLTVMIEDPREVERRRLLGIEDPDAPTRDDLVAALEQVNDGKIPENRLALRLLAEEMTQWPNLEVEATKKKPGKSLYARTTDTGIDPKVAAKKLNIDWDSAADIEDSDVNGETEVPPAVGYGALYLVTAFPVIIGISVVLILFYNSLQ